MFGIRTNPRARSISKGDVIMTSAETEHTNFVAEGSPIQGKITDTQWIEGELWVVVKGRMFPLGEKNQNTRLVIRDAISAELLSRGEL